MRRDIYKEVPEDFHNQFCQTLSRLEDTPMRYAGRRKKYGLILAAAVLACASVTAVAAGIMEWHEKMTEHFGTDKELEDKLSMENVAIPQDAEAEGDGLEFKALQAVRTDTGAYFLVEMAVPEGIQWNEDILFEECEVVGGEAGCVSGFVHDSFEDHNVLLELQLLYDEQAIPDGEEVIVRLKNLVQTKKTDITEYLVEGEWELRLKLPPVEADTVRFYPGCDVMLGDHELYIAQTDISPFRLRLYTEKESALHAVWGHNISLTGVWYEDGTVVEESGLNFSLAGHSDEEGEFCFEFLLDNAVDTDKAAGILISDGGEERKVWLRRDRNRTEENRKTGKNERDDIVPTEQEDETGNRGSGLVSEVRLLYVRYENVVAETEDTVCLWDARCNRWQELFSLTDYGFSWDEGGEICMGNTDQIIIYPQEDSEEIYLYEIAGQNMRTLDAENFWPWPTYEKYQESFTNTAEIIPDTDERYSVQSFSSQGSWYYLYSEDGRIENMELRMIPGSMDHVKNK